MSIGFVDIANEVAKGILNGSYSDKLPSINKMAEQFQVCPATIKRVISQLRDWDLVSGEQGRCVRVNPKAVGNPYFHKNIVVYSNILTVSNNFYLKVIQALNNVLTKWHVCLHLFISESQLHECGFKPDCIVVAGGKCPEKLEAFCQENKIIKLNSPENGYQGIATDNWKAGYNAIRHLAEKCGHRHIGMMATQLKYKDEAFYLRYAGALDYTKEHPEIKISVVELDEHLTNTGEQKPAVHKLMQMDPEITAIFASCDLYAMGVYSYAKDHDLNIPEDLSVIAFGDQLFTELMNPPLTTFSESVEVFSEHLSKVILEILDDPDKPVQNTYISPNILVRESISDCRK